MCCRGDRAERQTSRGSSRCLKEWKPRRAVEDKIDYSSPVFMISVDDVDCCHRASGQPAVDSYHRVTATTNELRSLVPGTTAVDMDTNAVYLSVAIMRKVHGLLYAALRAFTFAQTTPRAPAGPPPV